jgi:hypothetical protein
MHLHAQQAVCKHCATTEKASRVQAAFYAGSCVHWCVDSLGGLLAGIVLASSSAGIFVKQLQKKHVQTTAVSCGACARLQVDRD